MASDAELKQLAITQVGDNEAGLLAANVDLLWTLAASASSEALRFLQTKLGLIDVMLGSIREQVDIKGNGAELDLSDKFDHLLKMRKAVEGDIGIATGQFAQGSAAPLAGSLTTTAPRSPCLPGQRDGNNPEYRGDLYRARRKRL